MLEKYKIPNTVFLNPSTDYSDENMSFDFQENLERFKDLVTTSIKNNEALTLYKFGDGDYYFLKKEAKGSAKPGVRALKKPYFLINHKQFLEGSKKNDIYTSLSTKTHRFMFKEIFQREPDFESEYIYGLVSNKWLLRSPKKKIGLIGADKKLEIISFFGILIYFLS